MDEIMKKEKEKFISVSAVSHRNEISIKWAFIRVPPK